MPTASPLQPAVAASLGSVPDHDISSTITAATMAPHDHRTIDPTDNRHVRIMERLRIV
jgi:hypothetical protein